MTTEKIPLLDELERALAAATPGPWAATSPRADGGAYIDPPRPRRTSDGVCWVGHTEAHADAEAIVAAVNALPQLVAAARRVLDLADQLETDGMREVKPWMIARLLRVAITDDLRSALSPEASR